MVAVGDDGDIEAPDARVRWQLLQLYANETNPDIVRSLWIHIAAVALLAAADD
jgi:hypothetical protein